MSTTDAASVAAHQRASAASDQSRPRLWPLYAIALVQLGCLAVPRWLEADDFPKFMATVIGALFGVVAVSIWLLGLIRITWRERIIGWFVFVGSIGAVFALQDPSMGINSLFYGVPIGLLILSGYAIVSSGLSWKVRRLTMIFAWLLAIGSMLLFRADGVNSSFWPVLSMRWTTSSEAKYIESLSNEPKPTALPKRGTLVAGNSDWLGFRGAGRDGVVIGPELPEDIRQIGFKPIWSQRIGPGRGSIAAIGNYLYTIEQRDDQEAVVCLDAQTGKTIWVHAYDARFYESVAGAGPRSTPTIAGDRVITAGATGLIRCLDAASGELLWSADLAADTNARIKEWAFSTSGLVVGKQVIFLGGGADDAQTTSYNAIAYDLANGKVNWKAEKGFDTYASPQLANIDGVDQILASTGGGIASYDPQRGELLWQYELQLSNLPMLQPRSVGTTQVLFPGAPNGTEMLEVTRDDKGQWQTDVVWESRLTPNFSDVVIHDNHIYSLHKNQFKCVRLSDGEDQWTTRGFDSGQILLLPKQGRIVIIHEKIAKISLVKCNPERFELLGEYQGIEGITWNHPIMHQGVLYARNGEYIAAFAP
jgi:outer membrane protein assembly factor BamB